jgi:thiol:disulfide interchange protein
VIEYFGGVLGHIEAMKRRNFLTITTTSITAAAAILCGAITSSRAFASDFPEGSPKFLTNYEETLKAAKAANKPVVLVLSASWCPPCQMNKKNVYPSAEVKAFHDKFVWAYLDTDEEKNSKAAQTFKVEGIPHIEFLDSEGKSIGQTIGGTSPAKFAATLEQTLKKAAK